MALISLHNIKLSFGGHPLFDGINIQVEEGDRFCLLGRNGEGKSTLMKLIQGVQEPDSGTIARAAGLRVASVTQDTGEGLSGTMEQIVLGQDPTHLQSVASIMDQLGLDPQADFGRASGGTKRRALLARALAAEPDILLLDEPTNHLDIATITWLEDFILAKVRTLIFVTHDRAFAQKIANRISEIDRGKLYTFDATLDQFLQRREEVLDAEEKHNALFEKKLALEEAWIRRGIKARRTRDEGRVKALVAMRRAYQERRDRQGTARIELGDAGKSGDLVAEVKNMSFSWGDQPLIKDYSGAIMRGDRIGIVGPNGTGKTTLLKLLLGQLSPQSGSVRQGTKLEVVYFDQLRAQLDEEKSVAWNVAGGDDAVVVNGRQRHVNAYLQDFLFGPERHRNPVSILSGGERNRLLLAKLFTRPSNLLVLDEPTNDLDAETMDLLEDLLVEYQGTIILVSHDRHFLDNVVTNLMVLEGDGRVQDFVGSWSDWMESRKNRPGTAKATSPRESPPPTRSPAKDRARKMSFKEIKELEALPDLLATMEGQLETLHGTMADPGFYKQGQDQISLALKEEEQLNADLAQAYARWEELEALSAGTS